MYVVIFVCHKTDISKKKMTLFSELDHLVTSFGDVIFGDVIRTM